MIPPSSLPQIHVAAVSFGEATPHAVLLLKILGMPAAFGDHCALRADGLGPPLALLLGSSVLSVDSVEHRGILIAASCG